MPTFKKGILTLTIITQRATSLNYGETIGNVSVLQKVTYEPGTQYSCISPRALKYEIRRKGKEEKNWNLMDEKISELIKGSTEKTPKKEKSKASKTTPLLSMFPSSEPSSFKDSSSEEDLKGSDLSILDYIAVQLMQNYEEFDLFGTMLTKDLLKDLEKKEAEKIKEGIKRTAPVKTSFAFSVSKFQGDMDFLNNIEIFNRVIKHLTDKNSKRAQIISQSEQHTAHYHYTLAVDLDRIGVWEGENVVIDVISPEEKAKRVKDLLDIIMTLSRQIRGRWENLSPVFVIGGIYRIKNPFFMGCIFARELEDGRLYLDVNRILDCKRMIPEGERDKTVCGLLSGYFINEDEIREKLNCKSVDEFFEELKKKVEKIYGVS